MAYISKEEVANIRAALKAAFPKIKFAVRRDHASSVTVNIMSGDIDFSPVLGDSRSLSLNHYHTYKETEAECYTEYDSKFVPFAKTINQIVAILKGQDWFDKSDAMTDYFNTAYYISLSIGKWDKPYEKK